MTEPATPESVLRAALARLQADREHGAGWLARAAAQALARSAALAADVLGQQTGAFDADTWRALVRALAHARPSMAAIVTTVAHGYAASQNSPEDATDEPARLAAIHAEAERLAAAWDVAVEDIARHARPLLSGTVLTHSRSGTVEGVLTRLAADPTAPLTGVIVTESRPGGEGVAMARALAAAGLSVTLVADAAVGLAVREASCVALGADSLRADGSLVNKVGSLPVALAAHAAAIPVFVLSETLKIAPDGWPLHLEEDDPAALLAAPPPPGVTIRNTFFDLTPAAYLTSIVSERGPLSPAALRPFAARAAHDLALLDGPDSSSH